MLKLPKSSKENLIMNDPHYKKPKLILLDKKQWSYVQNLYSLTPRERQIAEQICQGLGNGGIAMSFVNILNPLFFLNLVPGCGVINEIYVITLSLVPISSIKAEFFFKSL